MPLLCLTPPIRYCSTSMWLNWNHAAIIRHSIVHSSGVFSLYYFESNPSSPHVSALMSTLSLFLPSRPPPIPACYLHPRLPRAALTHRRTPPLICRLRPQPTPTLVSVLTNLFTRLLPAEIDNKSNPTDKQTLSVCLPPRAHITRRISTSPGSGNWAAGHES